MDQSTSQYVHAEHIAREYDSYFQGTELFEYDSRVLRRWFPRPGRLIDLGCGTGRHLADFAPLGHDLTGIDLSLAMLDHAARKAPAARLFQMDLANLNIDELGRNRYDYAICMFSTLGLIKGRQNRLTTLRNFRDLLAPQGQLALHVHNYWYNIWRLEGWEFLIRNYLACLTDRAEPGDKYLSTYRGIKKMYIHVFTSDSIRQLLTESGFELTEIIYLNRKRNAPLKSNLCPELRANGFLIKASPR